MRIRRGDLPPDEGTPLLAVAEVLLGLVDKPRVILAADEDDEAHDGPGHVGGVAREVSVHNLVKRLEMSSVVKTGD